MPGRRSSIKRYAVAVVVVVAAVALESLPPQLGQGKPLLLLNGAVLLAAWYGGRGPAAVALVLAAAAAYVFLPPRGSVALTPAAVFEFGIFVVETSVTAALTVALTESRATALDFALRCTRSEEQLRRLNKAHRALSVSTETLVRTEDEHVLIEETCRAIVEVAGYRMCWVGIAEQNEAKTVRPIARAGYDDGYVDQTEVTWADTERGRGPVGTAIRTGRPYVPQDVASDLAFAPWRAEALTRGYASVIALPLRIGGRVFGALTIYADEKDAFDADAVRLLTSLGNDLAYGIAALRERACVAAERVRFETLLMQAPVAVAVYAGPDHVVRLANRRWFGLGRSLDAVGKPLREGLPEVAAAGAVEALDEVYEKGEPREVTECPVPRRRPDGSVETRLYNAAYQPLWGAGGGVTEVIVAISDVTDQVGARRVLEEARASAEQASRVKDEFLRIASHELRTPLVPILGWAEILQPAEGRDPGKLQRGLDVILNKARAEARLVDDLIDVSYFVAGTLRMDRRPVDLGLVVEACIEEIRPAATAKGIQIEASLAPDTTLWGDRGRLAQVAQNLLSNALKFTPNGGRVFVELAQRDGALVLSVHDTGMGISPWDQPHVFEPFRTGDGSTTRTYGGLGLGLCLVRYIVEAHGGTVRAESAGPGRGATLVVELAAPALAQSRESAA